jgi:hypothetical protein
MAIKGSIDGGLAFGRKGGKPFGGSAIIRLSIEANDLGAPEQVVGVFFHGGDQRERRRMANE